jgi:hypothetical protein
MKKWTIIVTFVVLIFSATSQNIKNLPVDCLDGIFYTRIKTDSLSNGYSIGTSFLFFYNKRNYLATAKHVILTSQNKNDSLYLEIFQSEKWKTLKLKPLYHKNDSVDAVLFILPDTIQLTNHHLNLHFEGFGNDAYILGFPNFMMMDARSVYSDGSTYQLPLIKKGIISGIIKLGTLNYTLLDIIGNKGFSGGPAYSYDIYGKEWAILGLVSMRLPNILIKQDSQYPETGFIVLTQAAYLKEIIILNN